MGQLLYNTGSVPKFDSTWIGRVTVGMYRSRMKKRWLGRGRRGRGRGRAHGCRWLVPPLPPQIAQLSSSRVS